MIWYMECCGLIVISNLCIIFRERSKSVQGDHLGSIQDRIEKVPVYYDLMDQQDKLKHGAPAEYEELRRRIRNDIQEMCSIL